MNEFVFKPTKSASQKHNKAANKIIQDVFFIGYNKSTADRFNHLESIIRGMLYVVDKKCVNSIINIIINNMQNIVNTDIFYRSDEYMIKYYQKNLRKMKKIFL